MSNLGLPKDGIYKIQVNAAAGHLASVGNYMATVWDVTPDVAALSLNQPVVGKIETPYAVNQWNFSAAANQQVRFKLVNAAMTGLQFDLAGPAGFTPMSNISSGTLINLNAGRLYPYSLCSRRAIRRGLCNSPR